MKRFQRCAWLVAILLTFAGVAFPQASSTSLQGTVTDPSGSAIPGALVLLSNNESKLERSATTGLQGEYRFLALPPGTYTLTVSAKGFARYSQTALQLLVNTPATANVLLKVGAATESITVTSEAPALNMVDASIGNPFNETQVKQIPLEGRSVPELLSLQAGVAYTGNRPDLNNPAVKDQDTRNGAVNGARSDQSNIMLDGVDVNDQSSGYAFTSVLPTTLDSVQEFRVTTSNYNADQGEGSGAQVSLVTKSGTNNFHGSLYEYHRNTITSANDYFIKGAEARLGQSNTPDKLIRNIFGVSVGGPIKKNRLFFFANYEGTRQREEDSTVRTIPTPSLCQGIIQYNDVNGGIQRITQSDFTVGRNGFGPLDPLALGINPHIENPSHTGYFDTTFCTGQFVANDTSVGDGLNYAGFRFRAPVSLDNNVFIGRIDYHLTENGKHTLFWRGALQNIYNPEAPFLPGSPPEQIMTDHSKGFVVGYTAVLSPSKVNTFHWGFTRQSTGFLGNTNQEWNTFYGLDQGFSYSHNSQTPVQNLLDDFSWTKGRHSLQFGGNIGIARDPRFSLQHSFHQGKGATNWMAPTGFANTAGSYLDPVNIGLPEPKSTFQYDYPVLGLLGMVSDVVANYNYDKLGNPAREGLPVSRNYGLEWYELYGQDSWRVKPNLTVTYGLRWSLFPPPWEVNGFQATPTCYTADNPLTGCPSWAFNTGTEFNHFAASMKQGIGYDSVPFIGFRLGGPANNAPGWYNFEKSDFSPRISFAYSPRPHDGWLRSLFGEGDQTVIRGGFSRVYDRAGMQLLSTFDANPPGGVATTIQNLCCLAGYDDAAHVPRIANINAVPTYGCNPVGAPCGSPANLPPFLQPPPPALHPLTTNQAITWGIDQSVKTPYAYAFDLSIGRELPKRTSLQVAYVGRLGRHLLTQRDLRQPLDLVDPLTGIDYYSAATALAKIALQHPTSSFKGNYGAFTAFVNTITDQMVGPTAQFWHDMLPKLAPGASNFSTYGGPHFIGFSASPGNAGLIQAIYDNYYDPFLSYVGNEVVGIGYVDLYGGVEDNLFDTYTLCAKPPCTASGPGTLAAPFGGGYGDALNYQSTSMFAWSSIGNSNYNALQTTLRKQFGNGVQFDLNYTYSKSIDITSSATRLSWASCCNVGAPGTRLVNAFDPNGRRGVSDFDTTHQINANWIVELPFGKGKRYANTSGVADAVIGGWELSGLARWTSGFPFTVDNGNFWATNWDEQGIAQLVGRTHTGSFRQPDGSVSAFANPTAAFNDFQHPFPGQSGSRNVIRGDGYAGLDMALNKRWMMPIEGHSLQFRWEVFNVPNLHRFNVDSGLQTGTACACIASLQQLPSSFGDYTGLLTQPRVMQFALRYEF